MIIKTLVENNSISQEFNSEHGLSLYIETEKHKILFDLGKTDLFLENAKKMNVDIENVDSVIISHGHYDHGGGLKYFLEKNTKAKIYIHKGAFDKFCSKRIDGQVKYIGLDEELKDNERIIFTEDYLYLDEELEIFSNVQGKDLVSTANRALFVLDEFGLAHDHFDHEQSLIITEGKNTVLIGGCAHKGIVNIINKFISLKGEPPMYALSGFHLFNPNANKSEDPSLIKNIAKFLLETNSMYYTGHCTGLEAFEELKSIMKNKIEYLATGSMLKI